jgi:hypothetical protein
MSAEDQAKMRDKEQEIQEAYNKAKALVEKSDFLKWNEKIKRFSTSIEETLGTRRKNRAGGFGSSDELYNEVDDLIIELAPLFAVALAGVESGQDKFKHQRGVLDDLLNPRGWSENGVAIVSQLPKTLAYVFQALHGAMCMSTGQYDLAIELADTKIKLRYQAEYRMLWQIQEIMGWPDTLQGNCVEAWEFLSKRDRKRGWLSPIFGSVDQFREALAAYYMALNVHELAYYISVVPSAADQLDQKIDLLIPLCFMQEQPITRDRGFRLLVRDPKAIEGLWTSVGVSRAAVERHWVAWLAVCKRWLANVYARGGHMQVAHAELFQAL